MLPGIKQDSCRVIRYQSDVLWKMSAFNLDEFIAGQLRTKECYVTDAMRMTALAAMDDVESAVFIGVPLQVRELRLSHFPSCGAPILLDFRTAWSSADWLEYVETAAGSSSSETTDEQTIVDAIDEIFGSDLAPISIRYGGDCATDELVMDVDDYGLKRSEQGDTLCLNDCNYWPTGCHGTNRCDAVRIKYIVGYPTAAALKASNPRLLYNILATFGFMHENPEMMQGGSGYSTTINQMRLGIKWRV